MSRATIWIVTLAASVVLLVSCQTEGASNPPSSPPPEWLPNTGPTQRFTQILGIDVFPEVWSSNGPDGQTYEFKTNCFDESEILESCLLFDVDLVVVVAPDQEEFDLQKDFNINAYSGEVTRRRVMYGPSGGGLPTPGAYQFLYYREGTQALRQDVMYTPAVVGFPSAVTWRKDGSDLAVSWNPPESVESGMWYKVLVFPENAPLTSQVFDWNADEAMLADVPLEEGDRAEVNVAVYFNGGYAYSERVPLEW